MPTLRRRLTPIFIALFGVVALGTVGYMWVEGWGFLDALYMTSITLTTTGFGEVNTLSTDGRVFTMVLLAMGVGVVLYSSTVLGEYFLTANVGNRWRKRRMLNQIAKLRKHTIVCGYGRVGWATVNGLRESGRKVVVIDNNVTQFEQNDKIDFFWVEGDATFDDVMRQANIDHAHGIVVATPDDADNLLIVLSARTLNPDIFIVVRVTTPENESKMIRAGANRIVSPYRMGGKHMANLMIRPHITDFIDNVTLDSGQELWMEELKIAGISPLVGKTVVESNIRQETGVNLIAIRLQKTGKLHIPDHTTTLVAGDDLIVLGTRSQLTKLAKLSQPS